jgi:hypothetical protein
MSDFGISSGTFKINGREFVLDAAKTSVQDLARNINAPTSISRQINEAGR